jgi:pimeloyl-ACP methyl ester carboxylesterase
LRSRLAALCGAGIALLSACTEAAETRLQLPQAQYPIPAVLELPEAQAGARVAPVVLLLHGTASHKNEVGNLYQRLARELSKRGIASLRIDFAGCGDSTVDHRQYTLSSAVRDARTALAYLRGHDAIDAERMAVLGFSQGGLIAQRVALEEPQLIALTTWSTAAADGVGSFGALFDRYYDEARASGYATVTFDWRDPLPFSLQWFEELRAQRTLTDMRDWPGPILAVAGLEDRSVPPQHSVGLVTQSAHPASRVVMVAGADHVFNVLAPATPAPAAHVQLLEISVDWLAQRLRR